MPKETYSVTVRVDVVNAVRHFPKAVRLKVWKTVEGLAEEPRPRGCKKLEDDIYRLRIGRNYRLIYAVDDKEKTVHVLKASTREGAY